MGTWISQEPNNKVTNKNLSICWEKQIMNTDENMIKFEPTKSQILLVYPGFYMIECYVYGCDCAPILMVNSEHIVCKLESRQNGNSNTNVETRTPLGIKQTANNNNNVNNKHQESVTMNGNWSRVFGCREIVQLRSNKGERGGRISIRLDNNSIEDQYNSAILTLIKLA